MEQPEQIRLARVKIGDLSLLLPHSNVLTVELTSSVESSPPLATTSHQIMALNTLWPVLCFTHELSLRPYSMVNHRFVACISPTNTQLRFALTCDQVSSLQCSTEALQQLPTIMHTKQSPIMGTFYKEKILHCVTDADHLATFLQDDLTPSNVNGEPLCERH